ncbi:flagellar hook assembly protein FlgD [Aquabacterium lacunae]|uniref:Basal-body rod modification protein FlgD n=1 Tax=Aquabacterium lacunae TaxID=2528630 RepID=A0A4Q9H527_9BURK|nr:flagellar hook capping FlgD N-terminal domain-containing protein [Aquabacterium lacunae]TBO32710.1 flagellar hook assembly protein FlgD [Aquabacterium lacunae]
MTTITATSGTTTAATSAKDKTTEMNEASDRFLKLLVTQMQNQDPMNPMDNAQVTSQMAQINTVTGIEKLNTTLGTMSSNFTQLQMLQGVSMVGHQVQVEGNRLFVDSDGVASGGFNLNASAGNVQVDITNGAGKVLGTLNEGALAAGEHGFVWNPPAGTDTSNLSFKVRATTGNTAVGSTPLMTDVVDAVRTGSGGLNLQLRYSGDTAYSSIKAVA